MTRAAPRLMRSSAVLGAGTALSRITGLARVMAAAYAMGATGSRLADAYNLANTAPNQLYELALGGILTSVLVPVFVEELAGDDRSAAWHTIGRVFRVALAWAFAASVLLALAAPVVIALTGPGLDGDARHLGVVLLRLFSVQIFFYALNALAGALLNAERRFAVPAFVPVLNNLAVIAVFLAFARLAGRSPTVDLGAGLVVLLGLGTTAGVAIMALANLPAIRRLETAPGWARPGGGGRHILRKLLRLSLWTILYVATNQAGLVVVQRLASRHEGDFAAWTYAFMFFQLPNGLFAVSVLTALMPALSERVARADAAGFRDRFSEGFRLTLFLVLPAALAYLFLARPVIGVLLQQGAFGATDTGVVAGVLRYFSLGLLPFTAYMLVLRGFYAHQDTRTPFFVNLLGTAVAVAFDLAAYGTLGVDALALGHALSYLVAAIAEAVLLSRRTGGLGLSPHLGALARIVLACLPLAGVLWGTAAWFDSVSSRAGLLVEVAVGGSLGLLTYLGTGWLAGVEEVREIRGLFARRTGDKTSGRTGERP